MKKLLKIGTRLMQIGFAIYLIENFYFGWNQKPMSELELYADNTVKAFLYIGFIIYTAPLFDLYEKVIKNQK